MPHPTRRLLAAATAASALLLAACGGSSAPDAQTRASVTGAATLRVADQLDYVKDLLAWSGEDRGLPFKVDYAEFVGGPPMLQAFEAGSVDLGYVADTPIIYAQAAGQRITAVAAWDTAHGSDSLVTAPGVSLEGWASIKGKKVAYQEGTVEEAVLLEGLRSVGLTLKDITTVNLPGTSLAPALENGSVSAAVLTQPLLSAYLARNASAHVVEVGDDITTRTNMLIASRSALASAAKQRDIADFVTRVEKAYAWADTHRATFARDLYVNQYKVPLATGERILAAAGDVHFFALPGPLAGPQQVLADLYQGAGQIPSAINVSSEFSPVFNRIVTANQ